MADCTCAKIRKERSTEKPIPSVHEEFEEEGKQTGWQKRRRVSEEGKTVVFLKPPFGM